jgi:hypothetical protein
VSIKLPSSESSLTLYEAAKSENLRRKFKTFSQPP